MFNIPVTLLLRTPAEIVRLPASVCIDNIVTVRTFSLDNEGGLSVDSCLNSDLVPRTAILLEDGRTLLVAEHAPDIIAYLDLYRQIDFGPTPAVEPTTRAERPSLRLITGGICDTSSASTPA